MVRIHWFWGVIDDNRMFGFQRSVRTPGDDRGSRVGVTLAYEYEVCEY